MARKRSSVLASIARGLGAAIAATLLLMVLLGAAVVWLGVSDTAIRIFNQFIKGLSVILGARLSVGIGGEKGFHLGFVVGLLYMILGYFLYLALGGASFNGVSMMGEILLGGAVGAIAGAIFANMPARRRRSA